MGKSPTVEYICIGIQQCEELKKKTQSTLTVGGTFGSGAE
jgi:hypothetical protein